MNEKLQLISQIFYVVHYLGIDKDQLKYNSYWYNDLFDKLYDMNEIDLDNQHTFYQSLAVEEQLRSQPQY